MLDVKDALDELWCQFPHRVDGELHEQFLWLFLPHIPYGQIYKEIIIWLSPLQETLAALYILHKIRSVAPYAVCRAHVDRGIELPTWPWVVFGRIAGAMKEHVVHTCTEHQIDIWFQLGE